MTIRYVSTRGGIPPFGFETVLFSGLAPDGGLYVPEAWPRLSADELRAMRGLSYPETTARVLTPFLEGEIDREELADLTRAAYAGFGHAAVAPLKQVGPDDWLMELFHGPTLAFKDFALQVLGLLFERFLKRNGRRITVVGATSGDTGSAAIRAFAGRERVRVVILHPKGRVSEVQRRQMTTETAENVLNIALDGTFDDAQALLKSMLGDRELAAELGLAAANSINWGRIMVQAAYYVHAALRLGGPERAPAFVVPTGNFGDVYAGYVAHRMGLPVARLVVATNKNDILARFFETGEYAAGEVFATRSPSMDVQVASNFERLLFEMHDRDGGAVSALMRDFAANKRLRVDPNRLGRAAELFEARRVDEGATLAALRRTFEATGEVVCPHTAVGLAALREVELPEGSPRVALATAHPAKFPDAVTEAVGRGVPLPPALADLFERPERFEIMDNDRAAVVRRVRAFAGA